MNTSTIFSTDTNNDNPPPRKLKWWEKDFLTDPPPWRGSLKAKPVNYDNTTSYYSDAEGKFIMAEWAKFQAEGFRRQEAAFANGEYPEDFENFCGQPEEEALRKAFIVEVQQKIEEARSIDRGAERSEARSSVEGRGLDARGADKEQRDDPFAIEDGEFAREAVSDASQEAVFAQLWPSRDDDRNAKPPTYIIEKLIPEDSHCFLFGPTGSLKSFVALSIMYSVGTGQPFLGATVNATGPGFYFCGEGYNSLRTKRRAAWEVHHGYEAFCVEDIWFTPQVPFVNDLDLVQRYIEGAKTRLNGRNASIFAVDTLNRALNGEDEDKSSVAARYLNIVKAISEQIGGSSITVGHTGWDTSRSRGSSAYPAGYDVVLQITRHNYDPETHTHTIELIVRKLKDDEPGQIYYAQSVKVQTPHGDSLALVEMSADAALAAFDQAMSEKTTNSGVSAMECESAIRELKPYGGIVGSTELSNKIADLSSKPNKRKAASVLTVLTRNRKPGQKFERYWNDSHKGWCLPGQHLEGCGESIQSMLDSLNETDRKRAN